MARLGIDFGTTNTVVVASDRGHFPVVPHRASTAAGEVLEEVFPSSIWVDRAAGEWRFGLEAERRIRRGGAEPGAVAVGSLKRVLRDFAEGQTLDIGAGAPVPVEDLLVRFLGALRESVLRSGLFGEGEPLECAISWPANSNGAQRHITRRAFRAAGFEAIGSVSEPAACAVEFADRMARGIRARAGAVRSTVGVFDLGGGTFDTSLVRIEGGEFHVVDTSGIERLGGDDFDQVLADLFLERLGLDAADLDPWRRVALLRHARAEKEGIARDPERQLLELCAGGLALARQGRRGARTARVAVAAYYERLRPLVLRAVGELERVLAGPAAAREGLGPEHLEAIYLVGGSSRLPLVPLLIRERFPRARIVASDKPFTSVAMGAAIVASEQARVSDIIARHFGVIRLRDHGLREYFAPIFPSGTRLPRRGEPPLETAVDYSPAHNIGRLQYLECGRLGPDGLPQGEVRRWSEVLFPYDPGIPPEVPLTSAAVSPTDRLGGTRVVERYLCDADGVITVQLERRADGRARTFEISRD